MIKNNGHGWGTFTLGNFVGQISYINNVVYDLLQAFCDYHTKGSGCAWVDEEGSEFTLIITPHSLYIISETDETYLFDCSELNISEIEKELVKDVRDDLDGWAAFIATDDPNEIEENRTLISNKLAYLERV